MAMRGNVREFTLQTDWATYCAQLKQYFIANRIDKEEDIKKGILLSNFSENAYQLLSSLCVPDEPSAKTYGELLEVLNKHFIIVKSVFPERYKFYKAHKDKNEEIADWAARVRSLAVNCKFESSMLTMLMRDRFIMGMDQGPVMDRLFEEDATKLTFENAITLAQQKDIASKNYKLEESKMKSEPAEFFQLQERQGTGNKETKSTWKTSARQYSDGYSQPVDGERRWNQEVKARFDEKNQRHCFVCGELRHFANECKYRNYICNNCGKRGHLAKICKAKSKGASSNHHNYLSDETNTVEEKMLFHLSNSMNGPVYIKISIDCKNLTFELDTGASCSVISTFTFQENLLKTMIQIENTFFELGKTCRRNCLIICDRGAMDASAFISKDKWEKLMKDNSWNDVDLRDNRYNQIVHMVSAANGAEEFYTTEDHSCRSEGVELAKELDYNAAAAWVGHPYFDVIDNSTDFEGKMRRMIGSVCQKMGIDTGDRLLKNSRKLKFLIAGPLPEDKVFPRFQDFEVVHTYLQSNSPNQVRLRKRGQKGYFSYIHTVRRQRQPGGQVVEVKTQITHRDYINLLAQKDKSHFTIYKKRRCFLVNNQYFQLDIYEEPSHPRCKGLMLLETYTVLDQGSLMKCLPEFLNIEKEVTGNPDYSMYNLSLREDWKTSKKFFRPPPPIEAQESQKEEPKTNGHSNATEEKKYLKMNGHSDTNGIHKMNGNLGFTNPKVVAGMS